MEQYTKDWFRSRGLDRDFDQYTPCEHCVYKLINDVSQTVRPGVDIHHVNNSFRGERSHQKDGSDLLLCCSECHRDIHGLNTDEYRDELLQFIKQWLQYTSDLHTHEMLWSYVRSILSVIKRDD